ncbi:hypothetical protein B566_EDAN000777 [Ephemera danica]|nr:hypothetical protein B566_EDAN000777 [Ephemera danica]
MAPRKVSWVRRRDWHILTSGVFTYTNDERFQVAHTEGSDDWTLQIKYVQKRDNGTYECQSRGKLVIVFFCYICISEHIKVPGVEAATMHAGRYH